MLFILAACAGILLLAGNPHGGEHLKDLLVGQILWVDTHAAALARGACPRCCSLAMRAGLGRSGSGASASTRVFAVAVTASVQLVGVYLVFSSLIIPALATRALPGGAAPRASAYGVGAAGYALGLALSALFDLPSGAVIVWTLAACALAWKAIAGPPPATRG